ncbi:nuclear transport factor 2 family protein, partial [Chloroflexota bacterium]
KLWDDLAECFTEDALLDVSQRVNIKGRMEIAGFLSKMLGSAITVHQGHQAEINITGETAKGIWAMYDRLILQPNTNFSGWGYYEDEYVKENSEWKIKSTTLTRLLTEEWKAGNVEAGAPRGS